MRVLIFSTGERLNLDHVIMIDRNDLVRLVDGSAIGFESRDLEFLRNVLDDFAINPRHADPEPNERWLKVKTQKPIPISDETPITEEPPTARPAFAWCECGAYKHPRLRHSPTCPAAKLDEVANGGKPL